jgi:hypothetical protein
MMTWFSSKKDDAKPPRSDKAAQLARKELPDDLMAQITGGAAKGACHTRSLT